ncbi:putative ABC transport system permease protein [Granulicella pectinivorans]|uniref:Putative ABC transport system permease protein n=1 Tax=Granulicella pectinivorans TaxID=474950 RepID=A0A1I6N0U1_9BACT|nr:ABC transporter permease [Granulicella pectinivorans]SFS21582.1 putative ABC transport system permease protein [Granulicella pectinivorans]
MFWRLLMESFVRQRRRKALAGIAILLGTTAVTAMLAMALTIGDRIHRELAVYGANIVVTPAADALSVKIGGVDLKPAGGAYLKESDLAKLKAIFWANNITGMSPQLSFRTLISDVGGTERKVDAVGLWFNHPVGSGDARTGAPQLHPAWKLTGRWPLGPDETVLGAELARTLAKHTGDVIDLQQPGAVGGAAGGAALTITGIADTDGPFDKAILMPMATAQKIAHLPDAIDRVDISARTKPEDAFARQDPEKMSPKMHELWYCRPYANSIAFQIREAIPGAQAEQVRQVEQSEGTILDRIGGLMWLISGAALLAAGFAVSAAMATAVLERRSEIGLMRSLGASKGSIAMLFYAETGLLALVAGTVGYLAGSGLAAWLGGHIFDTPGSVPSAPITVFNPVLLPVVVGMGLIVAILGSTPSIRAALSMNPSAILREDS